MKQGLDQLEHCPKRSKRHQDWETISMLNTLPLEYAFAHRIHQIVYTDYSNSK